MKVTDILITDYSSIYFDYLLLDKPILFMPFDFEDYIENNARFYYNYNCVTPGPKCKDWNNVMEHLEKTFVSDGSTYGDCYQKQRDTIRQMFNDFRFNNSERIAQRLFS